MEWEKDLASALSHDLNCRKSKNPRYSIRAFARDLKIAPATLSEFLRGSKTWNLTAERGRDIISRMNLSTTQKKRLFVRMGLPLEIQREDIQPDKFEILTDWHYSAIFFAHNLPKEMRTPESLSQRFGIELEKVNAVIEALTEKGLLKYSPEENALEATKVNWFIEKTPPPAMVRQHHKNNLQLAIRSLEEIQPAERDLTTLTFVGKTLKIEDVRKEIRQFHERIMHLMSEEDGNDEVMQLSIALFPVKFKGKG